jgi:hypothetical protein
MRCWWIAVALALCAVVALEAQTTKPTFEVASIKPNKSGRFGLNWSGDYYRGTNVSLMLLIQAAYLASQALRPNKSAP